MAAVEPAQPEPRMMTLCAIGFLPSSREFAAGPNHYSSLPSRRHTSICHSDPERSRGGGGGENSLHAKKGPPPPPPPRGQASRARDDSRAWRLSVWRCLGLHSL